MEEYYIRKATVRDVKTMHSLLMAYAGDGLLLPRPFSDLYRHVRDFFVCADRESGEVKGCCALSIIWDDIAEVRSLAISKDLSHKGWGSKLVDACLSEAVALGIFKVFTLTYRDSFFARLGFVVVNKEVLPQKVWADCLNCPKFPECDEIAMVMDM